MDFMADRPGIEVDFSLPAERVVRALNRIIEWRGAPKAIRVDNGPEYVSGRLIERAEQGGIAPACIQPGKPRQNACVERYNRTVRHEWLDTTSSKASRRCSRLPPSGSGPTTRYLTTTNAPTWATAG